MNGDGSPADDLVAVLLGPPALRSGAEDVVVTSRKGRALLYYLAVADGPVHRSALASLLWGEGRLDNVRQELASLRQVPGANAWLSADDRVRLRATSDVEAFEKAIVRGRFSDALELWRGEFLEEFSVPGAPAFAEWLGDERQRLERLSLIALKGRAAVLEQSGDTAGALHLLHHLLSLDSLDESAHRAIMRLEYARGNIQAALEQYELCRRLLHEELGLAPLAVTRELARVIQEGDALDLPNTQPAMMPSRLVRPGVLVGRDREWALLEQAWSEHKGIFIVGPPGVGKSRLMLDFARSRGRYLLNEGHATDAAFPLSTLARGLRRVRRALPHLELEPRVRRLLARIAPDAFPEEPPAETREAGSVEVDRAQLAGAWFELIHALRHEIDILPADDVHWFDRTSAKIAEAVSARLARQEPTLSRHVAAFRPDEMPKPVLDDIRKGADAGISTLIELGPLPVDALSDLLHDLEVPAGEDFVDRLHGYTGGNPMFVVEVLRDLYARGKLEPSVPRFELPMRITTLMQRRLDALDPAQLRLLRAVAVTHPDSPPELLGWMLDVDALDVAEGVGALERDQWLRAGRFTHDLQYDAVLAHTPATVAGFLHRRAADAYSALGGESQRIAYHLEAGGEPERAIPLWLDASRKHQSNALHEEAVSMLRKVVEYATSPATAHEARIEIARSHIALGEPDEALREVQDVLRSPLGAALRSEALRVQATARELANGP